MHRIRIHYESEGYTHSSYKEEEVVPGRRLLFVWPSNHKVHTLHVDPEYDKASLFLISRECACARRHSLPQTCRSGKLTYRPCRASRLRRSRHLRSTLAAALGLCHAYFGHNTMTVKAERTITLQCVHCMSIPITCYKCAGQNTVHP